MVTVTVLFVLVIGLACTVGLSLLLSAETSNRRIVDRETATREAMAQGGVRTDPSDRRPERDESESADESVEYGWLDETDERTGEPHRR